MGRSRRFAGANALAVVLVASLARAQPADPPAPPYWVPPPYWAPPPYWGPPPGAVPVVIRGERPWLRVTLAEDEASPPFARCRGDCTLFVYRSDYWLTVGATAETPEGSRHIEVEGPTELRVTPREERPRGGALGIVGVSLLGGGIGMIAVGVHSEDRDGNAAWLGLGLLSTATGLVLTIIASARGSTSEPDVEVRPLP